MAPRVSEYLWSVVIAGYGACRGLHVSALRRACHPTGRVLPHRTSSDRMFVSHRRATTTAPGTCCYAAMSPHLPFPVALHSTPLLGPYFGIMLQHSPRGSHTLVASLHAMAIQQ